MNKYLTFLVFGAVVLSICVLAYAINGAKEPTEQYNSIARSAVIRPDYSGTVVPPNIAPLNILRTGPAHRDFQQVAQNHNPQEPLAQALE